MSRDLWEPEGETPSRYPTTADSEYGTDPQEGPQTPLGGTLEHLDPNTLALGDNVREYPNLNKPFLDSIAEHGVLVPITAIRRHDGVVEVRNGQRRTLGARAVGLVTVPVYVLPASASDETAAAVEWIVHQIVTNDQKADLTDAQRARGIQQMIDAGLTPAKVAKRLSVSRDTVKAATTATGSTAAMDALNAGQLSLVEAAALGEGDDAAIYTLIEVAGTRRFEHRVQQLRQERESQRAYEAAVHDYTERGFSR